MNGPKTKCRLWSIDYLLIYSESHSMDVGNYNRVFKQSYHVTSASILNLFNFRRSHGNDDHVGNDGQIS